jgi:hypothetical protein
MRQTVSWAAFLHLLQKKGKDLSCSLAKLFDYATTLIL